MNVRIKTKRNGDNQFLVNISNLGRLPWDLRENPIGGAI